MYLVLHDAITGAEIFIRADSVEMVSTDDELRRTRVLTSSGTAAWVQETPGSVVGLIVQEENKDADE